jgi:hypothetical protein
MWDTIHAIGYTIGTLYVVSTKGIVFPLEKRECSEWASAMCVNGSVADAVLWNEQRQKCRKVTGCIYVLPDMLAISVECTLTGFGGIIPVV